VPLIIFLNTLLSGIIIHTTFPLKENIIELKARITGAEEKIDDCQEELRTKVGIDGKEIERQKQVIEKMKEISRKLEEIILKVEKINHRLPERK